MIGFVAGAGMVAGQEEPGVPVNFYGDAEFDTGEPVPNGTTIVAVVSGEIEGQIDVTPAGQYGGPEEFDNKLTVGTGAGDEVSFRLNGLNGPVAAESPVELIGGTFEQDLTFETPPNFEVSITDTPAEVIEGEALTVEYQVNNTGGQSGTQDIEFVVNGTVEGTETITLSGGELNSGNFTYSTVTPIYPNWSPRFAQRTIPTLRQSQLLRRDHQTRFYRT
jgi:CARDB.